MRICFVDTSTKLEHVRELETRARGGMVSSLFKVSDYLAHAGNDVTVLSDIKSEGRTKFGTLWLKMFEPLAHYSEGRTKFGTLWLNEPLAHYDVMVANRGAADGFPMIDASHRVLWTHDLPHAGFIPDPKIMSAFDCTVFMSRYAEGIWRRFYRTIGKSVFIPNGVDKTIFYPRQKFHNTMIFASAPNRGLDKLPLILDAVRSRLPDGWKYVLKAYSNLAQLHPGEGEDTYDYTSIEESKVELHKPVPQGELANRLGQAGLMVLPTGYPEICSNVVLQSLASGTPVITTGGLGATPEWVRHGKNGLLTTYQPHDYMIHTVQMVRNLVQVLEDRKLHDKLIRGAARTKVHTWIEIGRKWERLLLKIGG